MREHGIQTKTLIQCCVVYFANGCGELRRTTRKCNNQEFPEKTRKKTQGELWNLKNKADIWNPTRTETLKCMPALFFRIPYYN